MFLLNPCSHKKYKPYGLNSAAPADKQNLFNDSTIHVDFMVGTPDMKIVGTTESGEEVEIFRDGDFAI